MVTSRQVEIPLYTGIVLQRGQRFGALAEVLGTTANPHLRKYFVPAAKRVGADLLEFAVPEISGVVSGRKKKQDTCKECAKTDYEKTVG